ncbi:restriction endonuclease [Stenotrophomonas sp. SrG]|uniref:restriction endonuclease n=1 Tax=Stenotrophomonas sp. SrG TaxID=3414430 RepID=UPI003CEE5C3F
MSQKRQRRQSTCVPASPEWTDRLRSSDLTVDFIYEGGRRGNAGDDPLVPLLGLSNQGGFRILGTRERPNLIVLTSTMNEHAWPDRLDLETGVLTYYGDNRKPGQELHDTRRWGNAMLRNLFDRGADPSRRIEVPPVLVFRNTGTYRDVVFLGLAVPAVEGIRPSERLVATWHQSSGLRFQNYRAIFTILNVGTINRDWIRDIQKGTAQSIHAPPEWLRWTAQGVIEPLASRPIQAHRSKTQQLPTTKAELKLISTILSHYGEDPIGFERCAARITRILLPSTTTLDITRPSRDGGRDAVGRYRIGSLGSRVEVEFAMEAKCYSLDNSVGIKQTARLISRLRHRQFGVLITTSYVNAQAYQEIVDDDHPVLIVSAVDIVAALRTIGVTSVSDVQHWLAEES